MSEPKAVATQAEEVVPGVWHWAVEDDRIGGFLSAGHAVVAADGVVVVDPVPLDAEALAGIGPVHAICLTSGSHQRSAWRLRRELAAEVWAPALSRELEEEPDRRYGDGDVLPGGLRAVFTPGAGTTQHTFLTESPPRTAFVSDLLTRPPDGPLSLIPDVYAADPAQARESVERLLELDFDVLVLGHGRPVIEDPKGAIRAALER